MSLRNPIKYTSRTFASILSDINSDDELIDKPSWFKRLIAGIGDVFSLLIDAEHNNAYLGTTFTRRATVEAARMIDYEASPRTTANGILLFHLKDTVTYPLSVNISDLVAQTQGTITVSAKRFEARAGYSQAAETNEGFTADAGTDLLTVARVYTTGEKVKLTTTGTLPGGLSLSTDYYAIYSDATHIYLATSLANAYAGTYIDITGAGAGVHTIHLYSIQVTCYQQDAQPQFVLGRSDGSTLWQEFNCPAKNILRGTVEITINSIPWTRVDSFINSTALDKHFRAIYLSDGTLTIQFSDGVYGAIPGAFDIYIEYAVGGGSDSNVNTVNAINLYSGSDSNIDTVTNPTAITGGANEETIVSIQKNAPLLLKSRDRFVTTEDGEALALNYGGLSKVKVNANYYGTLSCQVLGIATGGGNPSGALKTAIEAYLLERTLLESVDVRFDDATITSVNVSAQINISTGYAFVDVKPFADLALQLFYTETGDEILSEYEENGIASAVTWINNKWSSSFTTADYDQIQKLLDALTPRDFGDTIQESDVLAYIDSYVNGVNYVTISSPAYPQSLSADEITTDGTMTVTEV